MAYKIIRDDNRFRVMGQGISLDWLPDTSSNRKAVVVFLRWLTHERGRSLFSHQELAQIVESSNRQVNRFCHKPHRCPFIRWSTTPSLLSWGKKSTGREEWQILSRSKPLKSRYRR